jgi:MFS family permease
MESERTGEKSPSGILTILSIANQSIAVIGPVLGGLIIGLGGWQSAFIVNLPISIACLILGGNRYPKKSGRERKNLKIDYIGMGLFATMMICLLFFLMNPQAHLIYLLALSIIILAVFVYYELRIAAEPFIPLKVLSGNKPLISTYIRTLLTATACYSFIYGFTQWLQEGRGLNPSISGTMSVPMFAVALLVTGLTGKNPRIFIKLIVGAAALVITFILVLFIRDNSSIAFLLIIAAGIGIPQGLNNLANQNALYHQALSEQLASSTGIMRTFQYLGAMLASAANGAFLHNEANTGGIHSLAVFQIIISSALLILIALDGSIRQIGSNNIEERK